MSGKVKLSIAEARTLLLDSLKRLGYPEGPAKVVADHLLDAELRSYGVGGLARLLSVAENLDPNAPPVTEVITTRESPCTAQIDGGDAVGYIVALAATEMAIKKAKNCGVSVVCANGTWYTGMLSYYAELACKENLVVVITSHCTAWVAPHGGCEPMFGTNPMCMGFPSAEKVPVIWDIGTSKIIQAEAKLAVRLGEQLKEGVAYDPEGNPTTDPLAALKGALAVWGEARGSGLAVAVQLLGAMAGAPVLPEELKDFGYVIMCIDPGCFVDVDRFKSEVAKYSEKMRESKPLAGGPKLRMPFERSYAEREKVKARDWIEVEQRVIDGLKKL
ncbi:malate/L-lactate dehydrogenase [Rhizodiscina lignyota]|uniref:Malate/L-lactate dehydrogenase n=1 Tax=Rhizodiscina lignyota TaxID=1504668 RepID=A0A9P4IAN6_9PEZI|nr:malate/L-lactate dehydrogenase [Rhizodiscina lignyota]